MALQRTGNNWSGVKDQVIDIVWTASECRCAQLQMHFISTISM